MKKFLQFSNKKANDAFYMLSFYNKLFIYSLLFIFFSVFSVQISSAQNIQKYSDIINNILASNDGQGTANAAHLESLIYDVHPKLYLNENGIINNNVSNPVCINAEPEALNYLYEPNPLFEQVELITIDISNAYELNFVFDVSALQGFSNLKYIMFYCSYNCNPALIRLKMPDNENGITVFYHISIPQ